MYLLEAYLIGTHKRPNQHKALTYTIVIHSMEIQSKLYYIQSKVYICLGTFNMRLFASM